MGIKSIRKHSSRDSQTQEPQCTGTSENSTGKEKVSEVVYVTRPIYTTELGT